MQGDVDPTMLFPHGKKPKKQRLTNKYKTKWVESNISFTPDGQSDLSRAGLSHVGNWFSRKKSLYFFCTVGVFVLIVMARLLYLQILQGSEFRSSAESNRQRIIPIPAERGLIFDRHGRQLVENVPNFSLAIVPQDLPRDAIELEQLVKRLAELSEQEQNEIRAIIDEYKGYQFESIVIKEDIDYDTALAIYIDTAQLPGIHIQHGSKRLYFNNLASVAASTTVDSSISSLSHLIGYQGKLDRTELDALYDQGYLPSDVIGKVGVEKVYERELRGEYGRQRVEVNAVGRLQSTLAQTDPIPGKHLQLSIDLGIQEKLESLLVQTLGESRAKKGSVIALDPRNGEILGMVSLPSFNNNDFSGGIDAKTYQSYIENENNPLFNRAIAGTYPSGSTIKPAIAAAALQEGVVEPLDSFMSNGGIQVASWFFPDWQSGGHGQTNLRRSLAWSVNTYYYHIGGGYKQFKGLGLERIVDYLKRFGFSKKLGIDLPSESEGFVPTRAWKQSSLDQPWYIGDTYNLSIGQGHFLATPLQIASLTSFFANQGTLYRPHVVTSVMNPITRKHSEKRIEKMDSTIIAKPHIAAIGRGMRDCVTYGSCRFLNSLPIEVAGKTGTAQWSASKENHAWFTSFAPFSRPEIVLTVMIEEGGGGSSSAVPLAYRFYSWWSKYRK